MTIDVDIELDVVGYLALSNTYCGYLGRLLKKHVDLLLEMCKRKVPLNA